MYPKFKSTLVGLTVALSFVVFGYSFGEPAPADVRIDSLVVASMASQTPAEADDTVPARRAPTLRRGQGLKRHLAVPFLSFAPLLPRRES